LSTKDEEAVILFSESDHGLCEDGTRQALRNDRANPYLSHAFSYGHAS